MTSTIVGAGGAGAGTTSAPTTARFDAFVATLDDPETLPPTNTPLTRSRISGAPFTYDSSGSTTPDRLHRFSLSTFPLIPPTAVMPRRRRSSGTAARNENGCPGDVPVEVTRV